MFDFFFYGSAAGTAQVTLATPIPDQALDEDASVNINLDTYFNNATGYSVLSGPSWATVAGSTLTLAPLAGDSVGSPYNITIRATDGVNNVDDTFVATVSAASLPDVTLIGPIPDQSLFETQSQSLSLGTYFANATGYSVTSGPAWATVSGTLLNLVPPLDSNLDSPFSVTVQATGANSSSVSDTFSISVSALSSTNPYTSTFFGQRPATYIPGHTFWCWDDPHGAASNHPNIHQMVRTIIAENNSSFWKEGLPGISGYTVTTYPREVSTGPAAVTAPVLEAQQMANLVISRGLSEGEVGLMIQNFGSPFINASYPFHNVIFRNVLDAPNGWTSDGNPVDVAVVGGTVTINNPRAGYANTSDGVDSFFISNGVEYWVGWMTAFCTEWKRLQREDPAFANLPDPTAFWFDTENQIRMNNILKYWRYMWDDPRSTDVNAMGIGISFRQLHARIQSELAPEDRLPEDETGAPDEDHWNGVVDNLLTDSSGWVNKYPEWSMRAILWQQKIEAVAFATVTDKEILPFFPDTFIGNWNTSSDWPEEVTSLVNNTDNNGVVLPIARHGTHSSPVLYGLGMETVNRTFGKVQSTHPGAPWVFGPLLWAGTTSWDTDGNGSNDTTGYKHVDWWSLYSDLPVGYDNDPDFSVSGNPELPAELQTKYASLLTGDVHQRRLGEAEIYWREAMLTLRDSGCRHFLLWWDQANESGLAGAPVNYRDQFGDLLADLYNEYFSPVPTVRLAKYTTPAITRLASGVPHWKLMNGIKSWSLATDEQGGTCSLLINRDTFIGKYPNPEMAMQVLVALHIRLGARAFDDNEQVALKNLIDAKYVERV